ncbi:MAG: hypothetical protein WBW61_06605, partial [Rhodanobacteraceae bacterium]
MSGPAHGLHRSGAVAGPTSAHTVASAAPSRHALSMPLQHSHDGSSCPCCNGTGCTCASLCSAALSFARAPDAFVGTCAALFPSAVGTPELAHSIPPLRPPIV